MARNTESTPTEAPTEGTPAAPAATSSDDSRLIMLDVPEGHVVTQLGANPLDANEQLALTAGRHPRNAVIRALAKTGEWERGTIAKEITKLQFTEDQQKAGKKVPYQIVFQATKGIPNVKPSPRQTAGAAAPAGEAAPASETPAE